MTIDEYIGKYHVTLSYRPAKKKDPAWPAASWYRVTLESMVGKFSLSYGLGSALPEDDITLSAVLDCVRTDLSADEKFDDFCASFGYDTDSRKAYGIWQACRRMKRRFEACMGAEMLRDLMEVEFE